MMKPEKRVWSWIDCKLDPPGELAQWVIEFQELEARSMKGDETVETRLALVFDYLTARAKGECDASN